MKRKRIKTKKKKKEVEKIAVIPEKVEKRKENVSIDMMKKINKLGADGWELVSVCPTSSSQYGVEELTAFLKKEIIK